MVSVDAVSYKVIRREVTDLQNGVRYHVGQYDKVRSVTGQLNVVLGAGFLTAETQNGDTERQDHKQLFHNDSPLVGL